MGDLLRLQQIANAEIWWHSIRIALELQETKFEKIIFL